MRENNDCDKRLLKMVNDNTRELIKKIIKDYLSSIE